MPLFTGHLLRVNLTEGLCATETWDVRRLVPLFLGGSGLGAKFMWDEVDPGVDPLGPDNKLFFWTGALTGSGLPSCSRFEVTGKSPLTGIFGEANCGGFWGPELKLAGFDGVVLEGESPKPVYLWITDGRAELRPADHLWGTTTAEVVTLIRKETGEPKARLVCIGPAGENRVPMAAILDEDARAAGRTGLGAVMGAKRVKAIALRSRQRPVAEDPDLWASVGRTMRDALDANPKVKAFKEHGTPGGVLYALFSGDMPIRNWTEAAWPEGGERLSAEQYAATIRTGKNTCYACQLACKPRVAVDAGPYQTPDGHGPEYETIAAFGTLVLNGDLEAVAKANHLCNMYGLDTISCGAAVGMAVECFKEGILTEQDTGGLALDWGNPVVHIQLIELIARAEGLGKLLGQGVRRMAEDLGPISADKAIHVKGLELPFHDPRAHAGLAVSYATSNRGACHCAAMTHLVDRGLVFPEIGIHKPTDPRSGAERVDEVVKTQNVSTLLDAVGLCRFPFCRGVRLKDIGDGLRAMGGGAWTVDRLMMVGERVFQLKRAWNVRAGVTRRDDSLPKRILTLPLESSGGHLPDLEAQLKVYYRLRSWNEDGTPSREALTAVGLADVADRLHGGRAS